MVDAKGNKDERDKGTETQDASHETQAELVKSDAVELEIVEVREGAFGARGTGDTSGFGGLTRPVMMPGATQRPNNKALSAAPSYRSCSLTAVTR